MGSLINHSSKCFLNVSTVTPVISLKCFGIQLKRLSVFLAGLFISCVLTLGSILIPSLPLYFTSSCILLVPLVFSFRTFSFFPLELLPSIYYYIYLPSLHAIHF